MRPLLLLGPPLLVLAACGGGSSGIALAIPPDDRPRIADAVTSGAGDGLASALLTSSGAAVANGLRAGSTVTGALAAELQARAVDHLRSVALGAGAGPGLSGSRRIKRLALLPGAPVDRDGDGTNWSEVLAAEVERLAAFAGADPFAVGFQPLFPWRQGSADLAQPLPAGAPHSHWRTRDDGGRQVLLLHVGEALLARAQAVATLLIEHRGPLAGANAADGALGLHLLHQTLAMEETLLGELFFNGSLLGALPDPENYDPAAGLRWLPARLQTSVDGSGAPRSWQPLDGASDLRGLSALLEGASELVWLAGDANPHPSLRDLFRGRPFDPPSGPPNPPGGPQPSWSGEIGPLMRFRCGGCHLGFGAGGFVIDTYQQMLAGSPRTRFLNLPMVVPFDHQASFLHTVLVAPPFPFQRMPLGAPLPPAELQQIDDWIDIGAPEDPPKIPEPPVAGAVLARAMFLDLAAMHFEPLTGALHHRHEGDGPSGVATAVATGRALRALAALAAVLPDLDHQGRRPVDVLSAVATWAVDHLLDEEGRALASIDTDGSNAGRPADLHEQAALTAGLLAAARRLPGSHPAGVRAQAAATVLLERYRDLALGFFRQDPGHAFARYQPDELSDVLAALREAAAVGVSGAGSAHDGLLGLLLPVLIHAEWEGRGEVLGDGIADTDGDGVPEPGAVGGPFGRLPVLAGAVLAGADRDAPPADPTITWSEHVRPLFESNCAGCHVHGVSLGDYRVDTLRLLATPGESGGVLPLLVPGDPDASFLYRKLVDRPPVRGEQMPLQRTPLDNKAREMVRRWILDGATGR